MLEAKTKFSVNHTLILRALTDPTWPILKGKNKPEDNGAQSICVIVPIQLDHTTQIV